MIAPRASGAFVCLRCELRTTRPRTSPSLVRRLSHANFTTSTFRRDDSHRTDDADISTPTRPEERRRLSAHPLGKIQKRRGKTLQQKVARLDNVKTLGSDASIIVIRELDDGTKIREPSEPSESAEQTPTESQSPGILASLEDSGGAVDQNEINQQLDSLRPESSSSPGEPLYITRADYQRLSAYLHEGFNVKQLSKYFAYCKGVAQAKVEEEMLADLTSVVSTVKQPIGKTQWYPGTSPLQTRLPGSGVVTTHFTKRMNKSFLVDQIVRRGWGAVLLEEIESAGELEVTLRPWQLILLNTSAKSEGSSSNLLDRVANTRKVKAEVINSSVIRITAPKSNAEYAANDIEQLLQSTTTHKFRLRDWEKANLLDKERIPANGLVNIYTSESLQVIGKASGAYIQSVSNDMLQIRAIDEEAAQEATRGLIRLLPLSQNSLQSVDSRKLEAKKESSFFAPVPFTSDLPFPYRGINLGRWTSSVPRQAEKSINKDELVQAIVEEDNAPAHSAPATADLQKRVCDIFDQIILTRRAKVSVPSNAQSFWLSDTFVRIGVGYQQALFEAPKSGLTKALATPLENTHFFKYAYSNSVPGLPKLLADSSADFESPRMTKSLNYEFVPSPYMPNRLVKAGGLAKAEDYPRLMLKFLLRPRPGEQGVMPTLHSVRLNFSAKRHTVLLPDRVTDMVFMHYRQMRLMKPLEVDNIKKFADAVCENIESGGRLTAPPSLTVDVPKCIMPGYAPHEKGTRSIPYLFKEVRHTQLFTSSFEEHHVVYASSQEGRLGQNSASLRLFPHGGERPASLERFVESAFRLADRITEAAADRQTIQNVASFRPLSKVGNAVTESEVGAGESSVVDEPSVVVNDGSGEMVDVPTDLSTSSSETNKVRSSVAESSIGSGEPSQPVSENSVESGESSQSVYNSSAKPKDALSFKGY